MTTADTDPPAPLRPVLLRPLARNWWLILLRGIAAILFGILAFVWPSLTVLTFVVLFAIYAIVDGMVSLAAAARGDTRMPRWWLIVVGIAGLAAGTLAIFWPDVTALLLILFIGWWSIARGVFEIAGAIALRREIDNEWMLIIAGVLSIAFGLVVILFPGAGALALVWLIGSYAIIAGVVLVGLALKLRKHHTRGLDR
ncbi:MAG: HdeD family acid-resistance protein [Bauldia sp.]|nr:HdeD family acid-resistance protein [Bauldia sp.]